MKNKIRQKLRSQRNALSSDSLQSRSSAIAKNVMKSNTFKNATKIGFYHSVQGEADPSSLQTISKQFYLPVLSEQLEQGLVFIELNKDTVFTNNKFSIPEPSYDKGKIVTGDALDLVIVPLLGFDKDGHRLGMGGGFYDRCFAFKTEKRLKPVLMGFAYDFQQLDSLKAEAWDVDLDFIATESSLINISKDY